MAQLRVAVVGTSCSGKTTLALESFRIRVAQEAAPGKWVIDGNCHVVRDIVWGRAAHMAWINLPFPCVFWQALSRTIRKVATQEEMWAGNRETARNWIRREV